ncbi:hypothetical protein HAX54_033951 [Datura stramonium]|uniref:Galactose oxidase n=1 Tax=Datura stramonium TaxID=4076 RepID=A0ABS8SDV2_DATST|nr:hypothetical protein [Datura stramonium]
MGLIKIQSFSFLFRIFILFSLFPPPSSSSSSSSHHHHLSSQNRPISQIIPSIIFDPSFFSPSASGEWVLLHDSIGISAMHMQLLYNNKVVIFDRTDFGASNISLPYGQCRYNDEALDVDCSAHSVLYDISFNTYRPLMVQTDVWCSSGALDSDGTLVQTGGYHAGDHKIRLFSPCELDDCDWTELPQNLTVQRWYASDHILPDGRVIIVGGRRAFSYEFFPKNSNDNDAAFDFPFLKETTDPGEENNLYPFLYLLPDGNLYIFANQRSISFDYVNNKVVKEFPMIPGEKRNYPSTGSSVMLPLRLHSALNPVVEVMICGGARGGAYISAQKGAFWPASRTCGRMKLTDPDPKWVMEDMPLGRVMPDMLLLPTGDVIILNGAARGTAGWESAVDPVLNPILYKPDEPDPDNRFTVLTPSTIPRMYHSSATLLPDGRILVGGSNPHARYNFTGVKYPTELSLEAFLPPYLAPQYAHLRPLILAVEGQILSHGQPFSITLIVGFYHPDEELMVSMIAPSFTTHSFAMNQRLLVLEIVETERLSFFGFKITVFAPPSRNIAPPGYYMMFVVHQGVPGHCAWVRMQ